MSRAPRAGRQPPPGRSPCARIARTFALDEGSFSSPSSWPRPCVFRLSPSRPMHADEAVHADKFGTLLEGGGYAYDPSEYHGPTLYYLTLFPAWLRGEFATPRSTRSPCAPFPPPWASLSSPPTSGREAPSAPPAPRSRPSWPRSPRPWSSTAATSSTRPRSSSGPSARSWRPAATCGLPAPLPALLAGACAGLMIATKETAPLALASMLGALALTRLVDARASAGRASPGSMRAGRAGPARAAGPARGRPGVGGALHLLLDPRRGAAWTPCAPTGSTWTAPRRRRGTSTPGPTTCGCSSTSRRAARPSGPRDSSSLLARLSGGAGRLGTREGSPRGRIPRALRFLGFYTLLMLVAYSAIPYKTPWCLLGFLHGMILLAGAGAVCPGALASGARRRGRGPRAPRVRGGPSGMAGVLRELPLRGRPPEPLRLCPHRHGRVRDRASR